MLSEVKADSEGLLIGKIGRNVAGINAAGQKTAHFNVTDLVGVDGILKGGFDLVHRFLLRHIFVRLEGRFKVSCYLYFAVTVP